MVVIKTPIIEKNIERYISNNFGKKERNLSPQKKFELFVNSMHLWSCSSQIYNSNTQIGKIVSLGDAYGSDAFFISINKYDEIFTLDNSLDDIIKSIKSKAEYVTFHFIQTKRSENVDLGDYLKFVDVPKIILKAQQFKSGEKLLRKVQEYMDSILEIDKISHKIEISFYTTKNTEDTDKLKLEWKSNIENITNDLSEWINSSNISINFYGSKDLNDIYEKLHSNTYSLSVRNGQLNPVEPDKYYIGYVTAKELLEGITFEHSNNRLLYADVFKNNIRLYLGGTDVNDEIEDTLKKEPEKFHFYNNGLTITTKTFNTGNSRFISISPVNIVNGCQTTNSIYNVFKDNLTEAEKVKVPVKIINAEDAEFENITIRTNSQNGISAKDLVSINSIQKDIELEFKKITFLNNKFFYKRQNSQNQSINDVDFVIHIDDILRSTFSTLLLIPNKVTGYYDLTTKKYLNKIFDELFIKTYALNTVFCKLVIDEIENNYPEFNRLKYHICYLGYRFLNKDLPINNIETYFRDKEDYEIEENTSNENKKEIEEFLNNLKGTINSISSNYYLLFKKEVYFKNLISYITSIIKSDYPQLLNFTSKKEERIIYDPVEKLKGVRKIPVFENFKVTFNKTLTEIITENNGTNPTTNTAS